VAPEWPLLSGNLKVIHRSRETSITIKELYKINRLFGGTLFDKALTYNRTALCFPVWYL